MCIFLSEQLLEPSGFNIYIKEVLPGMKLGSSFSTKALFA